MQLFWPPVDDWMSRVDRNRVSANTAPCLDSTSSSLPMRFNLHKKVYILTLFYLFPNCRVLTLIAKRQWSKVCNSAELSGFRRELAVEVVLRVRA